MEELTKYQRQVLINQYKILKAVDPGNAEKWEKRIKALKAGVAADYDKAFCTLR